MTVVRNIPPIGAKGSYDLIAPFVATVGVLYTCHAIRSFRDLQNRGKSVLDTVYIPNGLTSVDYERDRRNDEMIVTLLSETEAPLYVPSSYIASFPDMNFRPYSHVVLSASLGPLPDTLDLSFAMTQMGNVLQDVIGVAPTINLSKAASTGLVSPTQHELLEATRGAAITNQETTYGKLQAAQQQVTNLQAQVAVLTEVIIAAGLVEPPPP